MDISQEVTLIIIVCAFFLLVAIGIIILILVYQKKQLRFIFEKSEIESAHKEEILNSRIEAQEETLNNISKEIHDNIGQLVTSAKMMIGVAERLLPNVGDTLQIADQTLGDAIHELRALTKSLNPLWLEQFNFFENLSRESYRINHTGTLSMVVEQAMEKLNMPKDRQLILFRMVQETIQNSIKHGDASLIRITTEQHEGKLLITISDNGRGFDATDTLKQGFGIINIKHRVSLLSGKALWQSDSTGTIVTLEIPHQYEH